MSSPFSASGAERAALCPASTALPATASSSYYADRGTGIHAFVRAVLAGVPRTAALGRVDPRWRTTCEGIDFARMGGDLREVRAEVAYAYDALARSTRFLGVNLSRAYGQMHSWEVPCTLDVEGTRFDGLPIVADTKTGRDVATAKQNWQLRVQAIARATFLGADEIEARIWYVRDDGYVRPDCGHFTRFDLEEIGDELEEACARANEARAAAATGKRLRVVQGEHCRYCPAFASCPANVQLARTMLPELADVAEQIAAMTPQQAGAVYLKLQKVGTLYDAIKDGLKAYASEMPLDLGDGRRVEVGTRNVERFQADAALALLRSKGATDAEIAALYVEREESAGMRIMGSSKRKGRAA